MTLPEAVLAAERTGQTFASPKGGWEYRMVGSAIYERRKNASSTTWWPAVFIREHVLATDYELQPAAETVP